MNQSKKNEWKKNNTKETLNKYNRKQTNAVAQRHKLQKLQKLQIPQASV